MTTVLPSHLFSITVQALQPVKQKEKIAEQFIIWLNKIEGLNLPKKTLLNFSLTCNAEVIQDKNADWHCNTCSTENPETTDFCLLCSAKKPKTGITDVSAVLSTVGVREDLPPGFPLPPEKVESFSGDPRLDQEAYKIFMKKKMLYENWKNSLLAYRMRVKEGNTTSSQAIIDRLQAELDETELSRSIGQEVSSVQTLSELSLTTSIEKDEILDNQPQSEYLSTKVDVTSEFADDSVVRILLNQMGVLEEDEKEASIREELEKMLQEQTQAEETGDEEVSESRIDELTQKILAQIDANRDVPIDDDPYIESLGEEIDYKPTSFSDTILDESNEIIDKEDSIKRFAEKILIEEENKKYKSSQQEHIEIVTSLVNSLYESIEKDDEITLSSVAHTGKQIREHLITLSDLSSQAPEEIEFTMATQMFVTEILRLIKARSSDQDYPLSKLQESKKKFQYTVNAFKLFAVQSNLNSKKKVLSARLILEDISREEKAIDCSNNLATSIESLVNLAYSNNYIPNDVLKYAKEIKENLLQIDGLANGVQEETDYVMTSQRITAEAIKVCKSQISSDSLDVLYQEFLNTKKSFNEIIFVKTKERLSAEKILESLMAPEDYKKNIIKRSNLSESEKQHRKLVPMLSKSQIIAGQLLGEKMKPTVSKLNLSELIQEPIPDDPLQNKIAQILNEADEHPLDTTEIDAAEANFLDVSSRLAKIEELFAEFSSDEEFEEYEDLKSSSNDLSTPLKQSFDGKERPQISKVPALRLLGSPNNNKKLQTQSVVITTSVTPRAWPPRQSMETAPYQPKDVQKLRRRSMETQKRAQLKQQNQQKKAQRLSKPNQDDEVVSEDLPPGFPPPPQKMDKFMGGNKDTYKEFMRGRLFYEKWENGLVLYRMRLKEGNTEACEKIIKTLQEELKEYAPSPQLTLSKKTASPITTHFNRDSTDVSALAASAVASANKETNTPSPKTRSKDDTPTKKKKRPASQMLSQGVKGVLSLELKKPEQNKDKKDKAKVSPRRVNVTDSGSKLKKKT